MKTWKHRHTVYVCAHPGCVYDTMDETAALFSYNDGCLRGRSCPKNPLRAVREIARATRPAAGPAEEEE